MGKSGKAHDLEREMSPVLLECLGSPIRRQILRVLKDADIAMSSSDLRRESINFPLSGLAYHVRTLGELNIIRHVENDEKTFPVKRSYVSNVSGNRLVSKILESTKEDDVFLCRKQARKGRGV